MTLEKCVMSWEDIGLDRGLNPLLVLLPPKRRAALTVCQLTDGCELAPGHRSGCMGTVREGSAWWVDRKVLKAIVA